MGSKGIAASSVVPAGCACTEGKELPTLFHVLYSRSRRIVWPLEELGADYAIRDVTIRCYDGRMVPRMRAMAIATRRCRRTAAVCDVRHQSLDVFQLSRAAPAGANDGAPMMMTLDPDDDQVALINTFAVAPDQAEALLEVLSRATVEGMSARPGSSRRISTCAWIAATSPITRNGAAWPISRR